MRIIHRDIVSALIWSKDKKLFFGKKDPKHGGVYIDCWHIPGGGVDQGEDLLTALKREVKEETGIDISPYKIELVDDSGGGQSIIRSKNTGEGELHKMHFNVYKIVISDKNAEEIDVKLDDDLAEYQWSAAEDLGNIKHTPPSIKLFKKLGII